LIKFGSTISGLPPIIASPPRTLTSARPDLEAGKNLAFMAKADSAGLVLGARMLLRADSVRSRMASCAAAVLYAAARRRTAALPKA
jgi:phosphate acetyltransferase